MLSKEHEKSFNKARNVNKNNEKGKPIDLFKKKLPKFDSYFRRPFMNTVCTVVNLIGSALSLES